jgi:hypothetical protein
MPTVHVTVMQYECLACTHYNVVLRIGDEGGYSPAADMAKLKAKDESFKNKCETGHTWIVLPEEIAEYLKIAVCTWRNQGQNEDQTITDGELLRLANQAIEEYYVSIKSFSMGSTVNLPLSLIIQSSCKKVSLKLNANVASSFVRYCIGFH